jgi:hypothetical protein
MLPPGLGLVKQNTVSVSQIATYSIYSALLLTRPLWVALWALFKYSEQYVIGDATTVSSDEDGKAHPADEDMTRFHNITQRERESETQHSLHCV